MFDFFDPWMRAWYPDNWVNEPGFYWPLFIFGILCFFGFIWMVWQLSDAGSRRMWKLWLGMGFLGIFVWSLPLLLDTIVELVMIAIALALCVLVFVVLMWVFSESSSESGGDYYTRNEKKYDSKTGERIIKQDGRTYRQNPLGKWIDDKDLIGANKVEKDGLGNPKIEKDWKGDQKIERDWKGDPIVPPKDD